LRISGPKVLDIYHNVTRRLRSPQNQIGSTTLQPPIPRKAMLRRIIHPRTGETLDEGIVLYFPGEQRPVLLDTPVSPS
jgi:tRNA modification GTPase